MADMDDPRVGPFGRMVAELLPDPEGGTPLLGIDSVSVEMPFELRPWVDEDGVLQIAASAPGQRLATGLMPTLHRMRFTVVAALDPRPLSEEE